MVGGLGEYSDIILRELAYLTLPSLSLPSERTTPPLRMTFGALALLELGGQAT
jgi:hypothetical protein